jgi:hypothetical protein
MREVHFKISNELFSRIEEYRLKNNYNKTQAYISLIEFGLNKTDEKIIFNNIISSLDKLNSRNNYVRALLEQLYSDLEIENNTNPNKNTSLQEFKRKQFKDIFND